MLQSFRWFVLLTVFTVVLAGCGATSGNGGDAGDEVESGEGSVEQPAAQTPAEETPGEEPVSDEQTVEEPVAEDESAAEEPTVETEFVTAGEPKEIETTIEGMPEKVTVTPYTIASYGISYDMRTDMGAPEVDSDTRTVTYATQMGDDAAKITVQVLENTSVNDAVAQMKEIMASEGYGGGGAVDDNADAASLPFKAANYQADGYYAGFKVFGVGEHSLVVKHSYPFDAGDGMAAVMNEMLSSLAVKQ
ncbi:hypothetical protein [Paenibacillus alkalitolerans]|uniref:hypothetical protein n=1 Tax=Paenibacillus alkalitolerans TaxID=2799335 RepID=UPI0018F60537|nr:hypothetical protein [Paenibacillus alkalitolerans]